VFHANKVNRDFSGKNGTNLQNEEKRAKPGFGGISAVKNFERLTVFR
jgi:hypothetical protein